MHKFYIQSDSGGLTMVKNKRDLKSPRRRSLTVRPATRSKLRSATPVRANIKVIIRVRPQNSKEEGENFKTVIKVVNDQLLIFDPEENIEPFFYHGVQQKGRDLLKKANKNMKFFFDHVFDHTATNDDVFHNSTESLIGSLMDGCNCSVFVYGATGAGKTYTMLGNNNNPGITFLTMAELFRQKEELSNERDFELGVTYLEVYNENVQDLLNPGSSLHLREDGKYGVIVAGIQIKRIEGSNELFELLKRGNCNRTQHPTDANAESSRSHAVFQVYLRMSFKSTGQVRVAKLSMIDLAGSERGAATGCAGVRFTEGANINKSLLALGNCINSLADGQRHIPYRDSKLTRLLKDSLGGNCQTIMIANVSPSSLTYEDTYNTLKYATRAKKIKSNVQTNVVNCQLDVAQYIKMVEDLNNENERLRAQLQEKSSCSCQSVAISVPPEPSNENQTSNIENHTPNIENQTSSIENQKKLLLLFSEKRKLQERLHQLEKNEHMLVMRKKIKKEADQRLSGLCDTPDKVKGHERLGNVMERMTRQASTLHEEMVSLRENQKKLQEEINSMLEASPELHSVAELETARLKELECEHKVEYLEKVIKKCEDELVSQGKFFSKMATMLRKCYLQVKGHGFASDNLIKDYQVLVHDLQGIHNVTWGEDVPDSGVSSSTSSTEEESRKRKINDGSTNALDGTFVLSPTKPRRALTVAEQLLKVYKPPPSKRPNKLTPRKENMPPLRRPTAAMGTSQRFTLVRSANKTRIPGTTRSAKD